MTVVWLFLIAVCLLISYRNDKVFSLRNRLREEETKWVTAHFQMLYENKVVGIDRRFNRLPGYLFMVFAIWIPVERFEQRLKPLSEYYLNEDLEDPIRT